MRSGNSCGHDFDFHLVSWFDALQSWRNGLFYPHWTPSANYGAGEPRFMFYPPLTWMLGAALGAVLPWHYVPGVMIFLLMAATGLATRALARRTLSDAPATIAGCIAIFSGYSLFTAYERSAFAEMTGGFWAPLLLLFLLRDQEPKAAKTPSQTPPAGPQIFDSSLIAIAFIIAGAWLSNAPLGVMLGYLLAVLGITLALLNGSWIPAFRAAIAGMLGTALAAIYIVPAAWEQRWVDIRQAVTDPGYMIQNNWLFARHANPSLEQHDVELLRVSVIGVSMIAVALASLLMAWLRKTLPPNRRWWISLAVIPVAVLFLQLPVSLPVWNLLPKLRFLQFPWRWMVVVEAPMAIFFAAALSTQRRLQRVAIVVACVAVCLVATEIVHVSLFQPCDEEDAVGAMLSTYQAGIGFEGSDEYAPVGADNTLVATGLPAACLVTDPQTPFGKGDPDVTPEWSPAQHACFATFEWTRNPQRPGTEHRQIRTQTPTPGYLVLRLREYPAWRVRVNGQPAPPRPIRQDGLMAVPVPAGPVDLAIDWTTTPDLVAARIISLIALLFITGVGSIVWFRNKSRL
jgi:hypothetical protein